MDSVTAACEALDQAPALTSAEMATLRDRVKSSNVNDTSFLATDYLNHFNEIIMLMEMVPSMPDCLEDAMEWRPKSYQEHFRDSGLGDADLTIMAYENAPASYREPFDMLVTEMNERIAAGLHILESKISAGAMESLDAWNEKILQDLNGRIERLSAIINATAPANSQDEVDSLFAD